MGHSINKAHTNASRQVSTREPKKKQMHLKITFQKAFHDCVSMNQNMYGMLLMEQKSQATIN